MKKFLLILAVILIIALAAGGYFGYNYYMDHLDFISQTISSDNGIYTINTPASWHEVDPSGENGILAAENSDNSMYMVLSARPKNIAVSGTDPAADLIEDYVGNYIQDIASNSDDPIVQVMSVPPKQSKIGDYTGYYFELDTISKKMPIHTWDFVIDTDRGYVHIDVTAPGEDTVSAADTAIGIISSLRIEQ